MVGSRSPVALPVEEAAAKDLPQHIVQAPAKNGASDAWIGRRCAGVVQGAGLLRHCRLQRLRMHLLETWMRPMGHLGIKPHPLSVSSPPVVHGEACCVEVGVPCLRPRPMSHTKQELGLTSSSILRTIPPASNPPFTHGSTLPATVVSLQRHIFLRLCDGSPLNQYRDYSSYLPACLILHLEPVSGRPHIEYALLHYTPSIHYFTAMCAAHPTL